MNKNVSSQNNSLPYLEHNDPRTQNQPGTYYTDNISTPLYPTHQSQLMVVNKGEGRRTSPQIHQVGTQFQVIHMEIKQLLARKEKLILRLLKIKANYN